MNDFTDDRADDDLRDSGLAAALGALSPAVPGRGRFADLTPMFLRARRRRRLAVAATSHTAVAALTLGVVVVTRADETTITGVRTSPAGRGSEPRPGVGNGRDRTGEGTSTTSRATLTPTETTPTTTVSGGETSESTTTSSSTSPATNPPAAPRQQTFASEGGSITVLVGDRTVTLQGTDPAEGYEADVRASGPAEVEVRFRVPGTGEDEHRIRLRFDTNGRLISEIS